MEELQSCLTGPGHPFCFATLSTLGLERNPRLRTIKIREFDKESLRLVFYTDSRSKKILHIKENNKVSMLLYHPQKLLQLRLEGLAFRERDPDVLQHHWNLVQDNARRDYTTVAAPGTEIANPERIEYLDKDTYFCVVYVLPFKIEYLKLKRPHHLRVRFSKDKGSWKSDYLVP